MEICITLVLLTWTATAGMYCTANKLKKADRNGLPSLLCAGITTYSPLRNWKVGKGHKLAVVGLGGLGHMAVKFGVSSGAEVTILSTSESKRKDARSLGAHHFIISSSGIKRTYPHWHSGIPLIK